MAMGVVAGGRQGVLNGGMNGGGVLSPIALRRVTKVGSSTLAVSVPMLEHVRSALRHVIAHETFKVLVDLRHVIPLRHVSVIQLLSGLQEVVEARAGHSVSMALARDDTVFALLRQLGLRMRKLVQLEPLRHHWEPFIAGL